MLLNLIKKVIRVNKNKAIFNNIQKYSFTNSVEDINNNLNENDNKISKADFKANQGKAFDILKVANYEIMNYSVKKTIEILYLAAIYKKFDLNLLMKIEKKLVHVFKDLDESDLCKVLYSFSLLGYNSNKLNFIIERSLITRLEKMAEESFVEILGSIKTYKKFVISKGLFMAIQGYINKNFKNFKPNILADVFINFIKLIPNLPESYRQDDVDNLLANMSDSIFANLDKININKIALIYFVLFGHERNKQPKFLEKINFNKSNEILQILMIRYPELFPRIIYQVFLANYFTDYITSQDIANLNNLLEMRILDLLEQFLPSEINSIILMINNRAYKAGNESNIKLLNDKFIENTSNEVKDMNINELILYLHSILTIYASNGNEKALIVASQIESNIYELKYSVLDITHVASLLDLKQHFNNLATFKHITIESLSQQLLKILSFKSTKEITQQLFNDYYLITLLLLDLRYRDATFWQEFLKYYNLISSKSDNILKLEKFNKIIDILNKEIPALNYTPYKTITKS
jgi:hypothetical protein